MNCKNLLKNTLAKAILIFIMTIALTSCDQEKIIPPAEYPSEITSYVSTHFSENKILQILKDTDGLTKKYEVLLSEKMELKFNGKKEIIEIDGTTQLPNSVIPEKILLYIASNYPDTFITDWELDSRNQQIKLDNGLDLEFNMEGDFLRLDN